MGHRISINEAKLLDAHEAMMDEIYLLYHVHPTNIQHLDLSPAELAEMSEADAMGRGLAGQLPRHGGKNVVLHNRPDYCNGLPRRR